MAINTDIATISQTPALNGPDGSVDLPSSLDDALRNAISFIAKLRDGVGFTAGAIKTALGFVPVQQGTGTSQLPNIVKIGWSATNKLRVQVDADDFGENWPISVTGNAATADAAVDSAKFGGVDPNGYVKRMGIANTAIDWNTYFAGVYINGALKPAYTNWVTVDGRPTALSSFTNDAAYINSAGALAVAVARGNQAQRLENLGTSGCALYLTTGTILNWGTTVSDGRIKENIAPAVEDSLAKVRQMSFKRFNFLPGHDDGHTHKSGLIAQDLQAIDDEFVDTTATYLQPKVWELLCTALHAVQQLEARVAELEGAP